MEKKQTIPELEWDSICWSIHEQRRDLEFWQCVRDGMAKGLPGGFHRHRFKSTLSNASLFKLAADIPSDSNLALHWVSPEGSLPSAAIHDLLTVELQDKVLSQRNHILFRSHPLLVWRHAHTFNGDGETLMLFRDMSFGHMIHRKQHGDLDITIHDCPLRGECRKGEKKKKNRGRNGYRTMLSDMFMTAFHAERPLSFAFVAGLVRDIETDTGLPTPVARIVLEYASWPDSFSILCAGSWDPDMEAVVHIDPEETRWHLRHYVDVLSMRARNETTSAYRMVVRDGLLTHVPTYTGE